MKNKVIIIGNDHVNTLGVIRTFGENGIKPYVFITSDTNIVSVVKSMYVANYWICSTEDIALLMAISVFKNEKVKPVVIPTTDLVSYKIDEIYDIFSKYFIVNNINDSKNEIIKVMDKYNQYELAERYNLKMAKSYLINIDDLKKESKFDFEIPFPCILKPLVSAEGKKDDITICNNENELYASFEKLYNLNYKNILLQEFINYDYEIDIAGFSFENKTSIPGVIKKERIWPPKKGSTTFGFVENPSKYSPIIKKIKELMNGIGYNGVFDIDCFVCKDEFYINEINFRNGALSYAYGDSYICYNWYLSNINNKISFCKNIDKGYYFLDDHSDIHNVLDKFISFSTYKKEKKLAKILLIENKKDNNVAIATVINKVLNKTKINRFINIVSKIFHKDINGYVLNCKYPVLKKKHFNYDYDVVRLDLKNYRSILKLKNHDYEIENNIKNKNGIYVALLKNGGLICKGFIRIKGSDRFFKIVRDNNYIISNLFVANEFRGKKYQCDLILELVNQIENLNNNSMFYCFVYDYNIPSFKNFNKIGFTIIKEKRITRFFKRTIDKIKLGGSK